MSHIDVTDATFEQEVIKSEIPVLVDCWAPWCAPCRMVGPVVEKLGKEYAGKFKVAKLNVDENQQISATYQITSIPTLMIFKGGELVDGLVGAHPEANIKAKMEEWLNK